MPWSPESAEANWPRRSLKDTATIAARDAEIERLREARFDELQAAYKRGIQWWRDNSAAKCGTFDPTPYVDKAAYDYADQATRAEQGE